MPSHKLNLVPLGGLGEFGMNCMAVRYGDDIIVIDAGLMFPESELLGVDIVVPDITYLLQNRDKVRGIVLTHGHEDHIGALPWVLSELRVPVFGTEFTLALVENKLEEHGLLEDSDLREIRAGSRFNLGPFTINPSQVTHSLVDCVALAVHTPLGVVREARRVVSATLDGSTAEEKADYGVIKEKIRADLKRFIVKTTARRPLIMPVILEI